jgi:hypothetical protein
VKFLKDRSRVNHLLAFLLLLVLSFGIAIPYLRLYWDDWPVVAAARLQGVQSFWEFYRYERPLSAWSYTLTIPILGTHPLVWHIFSLVLRWAAVSGFWFVLQLIWPNRRREATWAALLFAIYPIFTQQSVAIAFNQHWQIYVLFFISLAAMLLALHRPRWFWPLTVIGLGSMLLHMVTMEYLWALELARPVILWLAISGSASKPFSVRQRLNSVSRNWAPYILGLAGVFGWWIRFQRSLPESHTTELILNPGRFSIPFQPFVLLLQLAEAMLQDLVHNLLGAWYQTIAPESLVLSDRSVLLSLAVGLLTAGLVFLFLRGSYGQPGSAAGLNSIPTAGQGAAPEAPANWWKQAASLGLLWTLLGQVLVWLIDRQSLAGLQSGRFALGALPGMSLLIIAFLEAFTPRRLAKIILLAALIGASSGYHLRVAVSYYRSSLSQNSFFWQLYWRAPGIQPGTALLSADELFLYMGRKPTAIALNLLYPQPFGTTQAGYWFLELFHDVGPLQVPRLGRDKPLTDSFRTFQFNASSLNSLVVYYKPGAGRCLWVLSPEDDNLPELPEITRQALTVANLSRILAAPPDHDGPPVELFGSEPEHGWCYYYQKAELARQQARWQEVLDLEEQASQKGLAPGNPYEFLPFIEARARSGDWQQAVRQSELAWEANPDLAPRICRAWDNYLNGVSLSGADSEALNQMLESMSCPAG